MDHEHSFAELVPVRRAEWREADGRVVIDRPRPDDRGIRGWLRTLGWLMQVPRIRLDELGSFAWRRFDGEATLGEVAAQMRDAHADQREAIGERLEVYVRALVAQEVLGLVMPRRVSRSPLGPS